MPFKDLDQLFKIQPIKLPIKGKVYEFPGSVSGRTGLLLHRMTEAVASMQDGRPLPEVDDGAEILDDAEEVNLRAEVLGTTERQMIDDGLPKAFIDHVFKTLITWHQFGEDVAKAVWEDVPGAPKAPKDRKPKSRPATSGKASTTKRQGSTTRTSASTKAPRGDGSSSTGD
jgi:hypothetical protein